MGELYSAGEQNEKILIDCCRELLGEEAIDLCDDEIDRIRQCADIVAQAVIERFLDKNRPTIH